MTEIIVNKVKKSKNVIEFDFGYSEALGKYFSGMPFLIEYPENIEQVPDAIAVIPFVCNVLPIIWLTDSVLRVKELDKSFYECIPEVRKGYETMFPESAFMGDVWVENIVEWNGEVNGGSLAFFSGGLDAVNTLVKHMDEKPALVSIWGSDICYNNIEGWNIVHKGIEEYAKKYNLPDIVIRSSFRDFDYEGILNKDFSEQLKDSWWHGVKHGIGLLGHAAPYVYIYGIRMVYIASSYCALDGKVRCASDPLIDNQVRFANARVVHDGFEFSRQDKVKNVVEYVRNTGNKLSLHVCWESQSGSNCCQCEKCYRTMVGLIAEGVDPIDYGFEKSRHTISNLQRYLLTVCQDKNVLKSLWIHIQKRLVENKRVVKKTMYWKAVRWMIKEDFSQPEKLKMPFELRVWLSNFKFYKILHNIKVKLHE